MYLCLKYHMLPYGTLKYDSQIKKQPELDWPPLYDRPSTIQVVCARDPCSQSFVYEALIQDPGQKGDYLEVEVWVSTSSKVAFRFRK